MFCRSTARSRGFTFLEIMFVVVIIGILLSIVAPKLAGGREKANKAAAKAQIHNLEVALGNYELNAGAFPDTNQGLKALIEKPSEVDEEDWKGPYIPGGAIPVDPWRSPYNYRAPGEHNKDFDLWSNGRDKSENTEDDVTNWSKDADKN